MDIEFLRKFIPISEMILIMENLGLYRTELERVEKQIKAMPRPEQLESKSFNEITVGMHYFGGSTDFWIYALDADGEYAQAFVRLNGDSENAESGPVYIPQLLQVAMINLDLHWDSETRLKTIVDKVNSED